MFVVLGAFGQEGWHINWVNIFINGIKAFYHEQRANIIVNGGITSECSNIKRHKAGIPTVTIVIYPDT